MAGLVVKLDNEREYSAGVQRLISLSDKLDNRLTRTADLFNTLDAQIGKSVAPTKDLADELETMGKELESVGNAAKKTDGFKDAQKNISTFTTQVEDTSKKLNTLTRDVEQASRMNTFVQRMSSAGARAGQEFSRALSSGVSSAHSLALQGFDRAVPAAIRIGRDLGNGVVDGFRQALSGLEGAIQSSISQLQLGSAIASGGLIAAILGTGGLGIAAAVDFESAFAGVRKTVDATEAEFAELRQGIRDLAMDADSPAAGLNNAAIEIARIAEQAGNLGIEVENILGFSETIAMLDMSTNLGDDAASILAQFLNITNSDIGSVIQPLGSAIVALGNALPTTEAKIADFALRLAGAGTQAGFTEQEILGLSAAMASVGLNPEAGGSAMTQVLNTLSVAAASIEFGEPSDNLYAFSELSQMTAQEFAATWEGDPVRALAAFSEGLGRLDNAMQIRVLNDMGLDGLRTADTIRRLSGNTELLNSAFEIANAGWSEGNALMKEAESRFATTEAKLNLFKNTIREMTFVVGETLLPAFNGLLFFGTSLLGVFTSLDMQTQQFVIGLGLATASGAAFLSAVMVPLLGIAGGLVSQFGLLGIIFMGPAGIISALASMASTLVVIVPLFGTLAAGAAAGAIAFGLIAVAINDVKNNVGGAGDALVELKNTFGELFSEIAGTFQSGLDMLATFRGQLLGAGSDSENARGALAGLFDDIRGRVEGVLNSVRELRAFFDFITAVRTPNSGGGVGDDQRANDLLRQRVALTRQLDQAQNATNTRQIKAGETLWGIAREFGISIDELIALNEGSTDVGANLLRAGGTINLPTVFSQVDEAEIQNEIRRIDQMISSMPPTQAGESRVQQAFKRFSQTGLFKQIFGELNLKTYTEVMAFLGQVDSALTEIGIAGGQVADGFRMIFSGDIAGAVSEISEGLGKITAEVLSLAGLDLNDSILGKLQSGDLIGAGAEAFLSLGDDIGSLIGRGVELYARQPILRALLDVFGIDTLEPLYPVIDEFADVLGDTVGKAISNTFAVLRGEMSPAEALSSVMTELRDSFSEQTFLPNFSDSFTTFTTALDDAWQILEPLIKSVETQLTETFDAIKESVSDEDIENFRIILEPILQGGAAAAFIAFSGGLIVLKNAIALLDPALDTFLGLTEFFAGLISLDGEKVGSGLERIAEGLAGMAEVGLIELPLDIVSFFGELLGYDMQPKIEQLRNNFLLLEQIIEGVGIRLEGILIDIGLTIGNEINNILDMLASFVNLPAEGLKLLGFDVDDFVEIEGLDLSGLERAEAANAERQQLYNLNMRQQIAGLISGERSTEDILALVQDENIAKAFADALTESLDSYDLDPAQQERVDQFWASLIAMDSASVDNLLANLNLNAHLQEMQQSIRFNALSVLESMPDNPFAVGTFDLGGGEMMDIGFDSAYVVESIVSALIETGFSDLDIVKIITERTSLQSDLIQGIAESLRAAPPPTETLEAIDFGNLLPNFNLFGGGGTGGGGLGEQGREMGTALVDGLAEGVENSETSPGTTLAEQFQEDFNALMEIYSPSQYMVARGEMLIEGLALGVESGVGMLTASAQAMTAPFLNIPVTLMSLQAVIQAPLIGIISSFTLFKNQFVATANEVEQAAARMAIEVSRAIASIQTFQGVGGVAVLNMAASAGFYASGGIMAPGVNVVGERGPELVFNDTRMAVLNNNTSEAFMAGYRAAQFGNIEPSPYGLQGMGPTEAGGGSTIYQDQRVIQINAEGSLLDSDQWRAVVTDAISEADRANPLAARLRNGGIR